MRGNAQTSAARIMLKRHRNFYMRFCRGSSPCKFWRSMITIDHRLGTSHLIRIRRSSILCSLNPRHRSRRWWNNNSSRSHDFGTRTSHHRFPRRSTNRRFRTNTTHSHRTIVNTKPRGCGWRTYSRQGRTRGTVSRVRPLATPRLRCLRRRGGIYEERKQTFQVHSDAQDERPRNDGVDQTV